MEVSHIVYVRKKSTSGVGYLTPSHADSIALCTSSPLACQTQSVSVVALCVSHEYPTYRPTAVPRLP